MTPAELLALADRLLYGCRDPVTGERLYAGMTAEAPVEDVEGAARYLRECAQAEPVEGAVLDAGGLVALVRRGTEDNFCARQGALRLYTHPKPQQAGVPQPTSAQARAVTQCRCTL